MLDNVERTAARRLRWDLLFAVVLILASQSPAIAQLPTGTILGLVRDASGAVVPEATLTARNADTGQTRSTVTGADGSYRFAALSVGNYEIRAEHPGFRSEVRGGLTITVSQEAVVNFALEVGAIEQTVAVTAEAPLVNTTNASLGGLVDAERVSELPLNGRNYIDLTLLQPGVSQDKAMSKSISTVGVWYSSNGAPVRSNNYLLDGAPIRDFSGATSSSTTGTTLGVEGIREYRVITSFFGAEYGLSMGSQVVVVSKSGTDNFHGSLFEYLRNSALDARNFFDQKTLATPRRLPAFIRNNFGGAFGGPIKQDKTFFFGTYEGLRERLGITTIDNVIPASAKVNGGAGGVAQISPLVQPWLSLFPNPNLPGNQFTYPANQPTREDYGQIRVDETLSAKDSFFLRYTIDDVEQIQPLAYPEFKSILNSRYQFGNISETHIFSPTLLNTVRFSPAHTNASDYSPSGLTGPQYSLVPGREIGSLTIAGVTTLGPASNTPSIKKQNLYTWSDDMFLLRGNHSLKFGALVNRFQLYTTSGTGVLGSITFPNLSSFLQGLATTWTAVTPGSIVDRTYHFTTMGFYVQDDYRVSPRFTLNLGLRYEIATIPYEAHGIGATLKDVQHDSSTTVTPALFGANPTLRNWSPRVGLAWDVTGDGKTALRSGFGLLYDIGNWGSLFTQSAIATPPFSTSSSVTSPTPLPVPGIPLTFPAGSVGKTIRIIDYYMQQPHVLQYNLTLERQLPFSMSLTAAYAGSRGINLIQSKEGNPTVAQVLPDGTLFWSGTQSRTNPNWGPNTFFTAGGNSFYNSLQVVLLKRLSQGLQFQSSYTWAKLIDETQGQLPADGGGTPVDSVHRQLDRGPAVFDIPQSWRFNAIYHIPEQTSLGGPLGKALNGWWMSGILSLQSGYPFGATLSSDRARKQGGDNRPNLAPGRSNDNITSGTSTGCQGFAAGTPLGTPNHYFDPCAFAIQPAGFLGNEGRNILRGPGFANLDFSLVKDTAMRFLGEGGKLQFRAEIFNILNRANFAMPSGAVFSGQQSVESPLATAGRITSTTGDARKIQFALRLQF